MEEQAASMMISMVGKGAETTVKVAGKSVDVLAKMAAFILSLWQKSSLKGQVEIAKLLKSGEPLVSISMDKDNFPKFVELAKSDRVPYCVAYRADNDTYLVTLKSDDLQRVKAAFDFWEITATTQTNQVNGVENTDMQQVDKDGVLQPNEMRISDFDKMVEQNKDNSDEMRLVHDRFWPMLKRAEPKRVSVVSEAEYDAFKRTAIQEGILFAPCVKNGEILLAYQVKDTERTGQLIGRELPYKEMVGEAELQRRQVERERKADTPKSENLDKDGIADSRMDEQDIQTENMNGVESTDMPQVDKDDILQPNEMRISDFDKMVEQNKDNSDEMRIVHDKHWPQLNQAEPLQVSVISAEEYKAFKKAAPKEDILFAPCVKNGEILLAYQTKDTERTGQLIGRELPYKEMVGEAELQRRQVERERKANTPKIENVNKDEVADFRMDEQDAKEAQALKGEVENNAHETFENEQKDSFDFAARKQEVLKQNDGVDFEEWQKTAKPGEQAPANLNLCLKTDQAVFDQVAKSEKMDKLNEAKAVRDLKTQKIGQIKEKMPKIKGKDIGFEK